MRAYYSYARAATIGTQAGRLRTKRVASRPTRERRSDDAWSTRLSRPEYPITGWDAAAAASLGPSRRVVTSGRRVGVRGIIFKKRRAVRVAAEAAAGTD